jgi:glyoxylase-like metal-dependent hydrolase (beta-lactamase superfamily II)
VKLDAICPEETVLHVRRGVGALAFADGVVRMSGDALEFVPDDLLGDDPEQVKADLRRALIPLLERDFDALLFAHGDPIADGGKERLRAFVGA